MNKFFLKEEIKHQLEAEIQEKQTAIAGLRASKVILLSSVENRQNISLVISSRSHAETACWLMLLFLRQGNLQGELEYCKSAFSDSKWKDVDSLQEICR